MIYPRRGILAAGFLLMIVNRVCGLVLPGSTKFLVDNIIGKKQFQLLPPLVLAVAAATIIQGVTSFSLTQLVSKAAQRLIAELRRKVQAHVGRLPVAYYDSNKTGTLVSRIMTDVEGVRNLLGTGLIEFVGGILTALFSFIILIRISALMTGIAVTVIVAFSLVLRKAFGTIRPIFRERGKINADVTGRLTESLGGVRVVKGYHAEDREAEVFSGGVQRLLDNVIKSLTAMSLMSMSATVLMGVVGATIMYVGARQIQAGTLTLGGFVTFTAFMAFMIAPVFQVVGIGTQLTEALAGLDRTHEVLSEKPEHKDPRRTVTIPPIQGHVVFDNVTFAYDAGQDRSSRHLLRIGARNSHGAGRAVRIRQIDHHRADLGIQHAGGRDGFGGRLRSLDRAARLLPHAARRGAARYFSVRREHSRERGVWKTVCHGSRDHARLPHCARG